MDIQLVLFLVVVIPLGIATFFIAQRTWQTQRRLLAVRAWARTTGRVIQSGVKETEVRMRRRTSTSSYRQATRYVPAVSYEYQVQGELYRGDRLQVGYTVASSGVDSARRQADRYPINSEVTVFYQPDHPAESTLNLNTGWGVWAMWGVALIMLAVTLFAAAAVLNINP